MWLDHHYLALKCQEQGKIPDVWNARHVVESRRHSLFTGSIARSANLLVFSLLRGRF